MTRLYQNVTVLGQGARDSTTTFTLGKEGDVHLTWENEAIREAQESNGDLEVVYPPVSIRAEPTVAVVDANAAKHHTAAAAQAYLAYLFTDEAQEIFAQKRLPALQAGNPRPAGPTTAGHRPFPRGTQVARDWDDAQSKFFR